MNRYAIAVRNMLLPIVCCLFFMKATAQIKLTPQSDAIWQLGWAAKASIDLQSGWPFVRLSIVGGVGVAVIGKAVYPSLHGEFSWYSGGEGTRSGSGLPKSQSTADFILSPTLTLGAEYKMHQLSSHELLERNIPLKYFGDMAPTALQNPYGYSFSLGTNLVFPFDPDKHGMQQVGMIDFHVGRFQFGYYNDGGGMEALTCLKIPLGDGYDRYYTGGGFMLYSLPNSYRVNTLEISYHKFSGFFNNAFELSNRMGLSFDNYFDATQQYYNKSDWSFSLSSTYYGKGMTFKINNPYNRSDIQNLIHHTGYFTYHQLHFPKFFSLGFNEFYSATSIGNR